MNISWVRAACLCKQRRIKNNVAFVCSSVVSHTRSGSIAFRSLPRRLSASIVQCMPKSRIQLALESLLYLQCRRNFHCSLCGTDKLYALLVHHLWAISFECLCILDNSSNWAFKGTPKRQVIFLALGNFSFAMPTLASTRLVVNMPKEILGSGATLKFMH